MQILVTMTAKDGRVCRLENVFLRGGQIKFIVLPELLKNSPILKKVQQMKSKRVEQEAPKGNKTGGMGVNAKKQKRS
jgi:small nuclear ribonucleoprotein D3